MKVTCSYSYFEQQKKFVLFEVLESLQKCLKVCVKVHNVEEELWDTIIITASFFYIPVV